MFGGAMARARQRAVPIADLSGLKHGPQQSRPKRTVGNAGLAQMPAARNTRRERLLSWAEIRHRDRPAPGYGHGSLIRHAGLAQAREVGGFGEGADRHPISACLQASEARIAIITS